MTVRIDVTQSRTSPEAGVYRVTTTVTYVENISNAIFVYDLPSDTFSHVAYPSDMETLPAGPESASTFYRKSEAVQDFANIDTAVKGAAYTLGRINFLAKKYEVTVDTFLGSGEYTFEGDA